MNIANNLTPVTAKRWAEAHPRAVGVAVIRELLDYVERREQGYNADRYDARKMRDQARVIEDQRRYIATLEEQLAPHLVTERGPGPEQEALL